MKAVVRPIPFPQSGRLLAVSDVHGNLPWLKGLLDKVGFTPDDALVLVGDLVEKGPDSLATLRYVMELSKTHTVHALCGNCDNLAVDFVDQNAGLGRDFFRGYLSVWKERSLITQMAMVLPRGPARPAGRPAGAVRPRAGFPPEPPHHPHRPGLCLRPRRRPLLRPYGGAGRLEVHEKRRLPLPGPLLPLLLRGGPLAGDPLPHRPALL